MRTNGLVARIALAGATTLFVGCSPAVHGYLLSHRGDTELLIPPGVTLPANGALEVKLLHARKAPFSRSGCEIERDPISIRWSGSTAYVRDKPGSGLLGFGQGSTREQPVVLDPRGSVSGQPIALDPLQSINDLRKDLIGLEANGCLRGGEGQRLAATIAEKFPFQPFLAYLLRFGAFDLNQFIDLTPDFRLRIVYPKYSENASQRKQIKGVETVYYKIAPEQKDGRVRIIAAAQKSANQVVSPFPPSSAYFRLFLKRSNSSKDPITVAIILSSKDRKSLDDATKALDASAEASCRAVLSPDANCILFPPLTGVNAEIRVRVNGKEAFAELGARVDQLIHEVGDYDAPRSVEVKRLFDRRLVPMKTDSDNKELLALILMPGDEVNYR